MCACEGREHRTGYCSVCGERQFRRTRPGFEKPEGMCTVALDSFPDDADMPQVWEGDDG